MIGTTPEDMAVVVLFAVLLVPELLAGIVFVLSLVATAVLLVFVGARARFDEARKQRLARRGGK